MLNHFVPLLSFKLWSSSCLLWFIYLFIFLSPLTAEIILHDVQLQRDQWAVPLCLILGQPPHFILLLKCFSQPAKMTDRKEPPFFNDDSLGAFQYKLPFYDSMELFIETLTGTCFELRVLPFEAVISVKAKIQRLEGIKLANI